MRHCLSRLVVLVVAARAIYSLHYLPPPKPTDGIFVLVPACPPPPIYFPRQWQSILLSNCPLTPLVTIYSRPVLPGNIPTNYSRLIYDRTRFLQRFWTEQEFFISERGTPCTPFGRLHQKRWKNFPPLPLSPCCFSLKISILRRERFLIFE